MLFEILKRTGSLTNSNLETLYSDIMGVLDNHIKNNYIEADEQNIYFASSDEFLDRYGNGALIRVVLVNKLGDPIIRHEMSMFKVSRVYVQPLEEIMIDTTFSDDEIMASNNLVNSFFNHNDISDNEKPEKWRTIIYEMDKKIRVLRANNKEIPTIVLLARRLVKSHYKILGLDASKGIPHALLKYKYEPLTLTIQEFDGEVLQEFYNENPDIKWWTPGILRILSIRQVLSDIMDYVDEHPMIKNDSEIKEMLGPLAFGQIQLGKQAEKQIRTTLMIRDYPESYDKGYRWY